jgi:hypothetical protein
MENRISNQKQKIKMNTKTVTPVEKEELETITPKTTPKIIKRPVIDLGPDSDVAISEIEVGDEFTRIDFFYISSRLYVNGGWIQMHPSCYIRPKGTDLKLTMIKAEGIPIAPIKYHFQCQGQAHSYSLYFPALPKGTTMIDVIERDGHYPNDFNFYCVRVRENLPIEIRFISEN